MTDPDEACVVLKVPRDGTDVEVCRWLGTQRLSRVEAEGRARKWLLDYPAYTYVAVPVTP